MWEWRAGKWLIQVAEWVGCEHETNFNKLISTFKWFQWNKQTISSFNRSNISHLRRRNYHSALAKMFTPRFLSQCTVFPTLDSRGYFLALKRATKEGVSKRREKPLEQAINPSEHAAPITLRLPLPESSFDPGDFIGRSTNRFYKDCHWLSRGGRSNRFFTGVIQEWTWQ